MSEQASQQLPKVFISYSWTTPRHELWVLKLAEDLSESVVDVILDKWDLAEGADKYHFMEKMVNDPSITKVLLICDRAYSEKANQRRAGVGNETQIITPEIYEQVDPSAREQKFIPIITERDENGNPFIPAYLKSRMYIDMSDPTRQADAFEQLVRCIYGKPQYQRPPLGKTPPAYILAEEKKSLGTNARFRHAIDAVKFNKDYALGAIEDYFTTFAENLEEFRIEPEKDKPFDELVVESVASFLPYRDEAVELFLAIARYRTDLEAYSFVHRFFESILPYFYKPATVTSWQDCYFDNFKFITEELFIYAITAFIKHNRFDGANELLEQGYYPPKNFPYRDNNLSLFSYPIFNSHLESLRVRKQRLKLNRISLKADLIKERALRLDITFEDLMQTDFLLYIRDELTREKGEWSSFSWYPETLVFAENHYSPFEIFLRATSKKYFTNMKKILSVDSPESLVQLVNELYSDERKLPRWEFGRFSPKLLMNPEKIATRP
jgi:hypothetical protein